MCRATAPEVLTAYLSKVGGKEAIIAEWEEKKGSSEPRGRKRGRSSVGANGGEAPKKKGRKSHPGNSTPPASAKQEFKPPTGSWEEDVIAIDACEGSKGDVLVYLTWKGQHKTQHPLSQVYKRCPQRVSQLSCAKPLFTNENRCSNSTRATSYSRRRSNLMMNLEADNNKFFLLCLANKPYQSTFHDNSTPFSTSTCIFSSRVLYINLFSLELSLRDISRQAGR
jgi:hypothetical protein